MPDDENPADFDSEPSANASPSLTNPRGAGTKRKRGLAAISSSRSVASLTPEQLEKKRKNDREAQRAIRERTKNHIDTLNDQIRAFEQSQPHVELIAAKRERERIQEENDTLRLKMRQAISLLQTDANSISASASGTIVRDGTQSGRMDRQGSMTQLAAAGRLPPMQMGTGIFEPASMPAIRSPVYMASPGSQGTYTHGYGTPVLATAQRRSWPSPALSAEHSHRPTEEERDIPFQLGDERLERGYVLNNTNSAFVQLPYSVTPEQKAPAPYAPPIYQMMPRVVFDCHLDGVLLRFLADTQTAHANGQPLSELEGPAYPSYTAMLNPHTTHKPHELSKMLLGVLNTFPDLSRLPQQIAVFHMLYLLMRWQIRPTKDNYDRIPEWLHPRPTQLFVSHPHWLDYIPWPRLRDACCQAIPYPNFEDFFVPYTKTFSVNWKLSPELCLMPAPSNGSSSSHHSTPTASSPYPPPQPMQAPPPRHSHSPRPPPPMSPGTEEPQLILSPMFEAHIMDLSNWSLGSMFRDQYPQWAGLWTMKDDQSSKGQFFEK